MRIGAQHLQSRQRYEAMHSTAVQQGAQQLAAARAAGSARHRGLLPLPARGGTRSASASSRRCSTSSPTTTEHEWKSWRDYAEKQIQAVKKWRSLEEKLVTFEGARLNDKVWDSTQANGVRIIVEEGALKFEGRANTDGSFAKPIAFAKTITFFERDTFESLVMTLKIPREKGGSTTNNITFGVQVGSDTGRAGGGNKKRPGLGIFYDRAKIAIRIQGGQIKKYKEGNVTRLDPAQDWPGDEVELRIVKLDPQKGTVGLYLNGELVIQDNISAFKSARGKAMLWIGGYSTETQDFDVEVSDIRIVRRKK